MSKEVGPKPYVFQVTDIRFLREQDGPPERCLKNELIALFASNPQIVRAYLAQIRYADDTEIALCVRCANEQQDQQRRIAAEVSAVFSLTFDAHAHLDILFVSEPQEVALQDVCRPFYTVEFGDEND